jgi:hypothetical protein
MVSNFTKNSSYMSSVVHFQLAFRSMILSAPKRVYTLGALQMILKAWEVEIHVSALPHSSLDNTNLS